MNPSSPATLLSFTVHGEPAPQGSMRSLGAGRPVIDSNRDRLEPWRNTIAAAAARQLDGQPLLAGPLRLICVFSFPRPKSHYGSGRNAGQLKPSAPLYCDRRPDLDKLVRAIGDALTGVAVHDDAQFVELVASKRYGVPSCHITIKAAA